jgi:hypothetical protein
MDDFSGGQDIVADADAGSSHPESRVLYIVPQP